MFHSLDEARRRRADGDRLDLYWRSMPLDGNSAAVMLGLILAEKLFGWAPPWRRPPPEAAPAPLVLSLSRPRQRRGVFRLSPPLRRPAND